MNSHIPFSLPGISPETLSQAGVRHVDTSTAQILCGITEPGIIFPYFRSSGVPVTDGGSDFHRLRLDNPKAGKKYHQRGGTKPHIYLPPRIWHAKRLDQIITVVEGEKKALCLADSGFGAIGIGGFFNFGDGEGGLAPELAEILDDLPNPVLFLFLGDQDVQFNFQFAQAALKFAKLVPDAHVRSASVSLNAPGKGIDDCRGALGAEFKDDWMTKLCTGLHHIEPATTKPGDIALALLNGNRQALEHLDGTKRDTAIRKLVELCAAMHRSPLNAERLMKFLEGYADIGRANVKRMVKEAHGRLQVESQLAAGSGDEIVVDLAQQAGEWTMLALMAMAQKTFLYGVNLCDHVDRKLEPLTPAALVSRIDKPGVCRFVKGAGTGGASPARLTESDARIITGAISQYSELLRPVEVFSPTPVLIWNGTGPEIISGYSREHRILAGDGEMVLPEIGEAQTKLQGLLVDFKFQSKGDAARTLSFLITLALANGRFLESGRSPFFLIEKNQLGAGGGFLVRLMAAIYGIKEISLSPDEQKGARESLSDALLQGARFAYFDNVRGNVLQKLGFFESLLTEPNFVCRKLYLQGSVNVEQHVFACTSNGAIFSPDLADRTVKIGICKQPADYVYHPWKEGSLIDHAKANQAEYLACIYAIIEYWATSGRPSGARLSGLRFTEWERACAWIVEQLMPDIMLLDSDHQTAQNRMSNPDFELLRIVFDDILGRGLTDWLSATDMVRVALSMLILPDDEKTTLLKLGRILTRQFPSEGAFEFEGKKIVRHDRKNPHGDLMKTYQITRS